MILCIRLGQTTRDQAIAAKDALRRLPERPVGMVLTGSKPGSDYDYSGYPAPPGRGRGSRLGLVPDLQPAPRRAFGDLAENPVEVRAEELRGEVLDRIAVASHAPRTHLVGTIEGIGYRFGE